MTMVTVWWTFARRRRASSHRVLIKRQVLFFTEELFLIERTLNCFVSTSKGVYKVVDANRIQPESDSDEADEEEEEEEEEEEDIQEEDDDDESNQQGFILLLFFTSIYEHCSYCCFQLGPSGKKTTVVCLQVVMFCCYWTNADLELKRDL